MKNLFFIISILSSVYSFGQLPADFPEKWRNKVICGQASTSTPSGSMYGTSFLDFPFRLTVSDDGISAEYNLDEKFGEENWGKTQTVTEFIEHTREPVYDTYGVLYAHVIYYKVPNVGRNSMGEVSSKHSIFQISLQKYLDQSMPSILTVKLFSGAYESTSISSNNVKFSICETLLSKEERIKIESQKKDLDVETTKKVISFLNENNVSAARTNFNMLNYPMNFPVEYKKILEIKEDSLKIQRINSLIKTNNIEDAASLYTTLNFSNLELKNEIQQLLENKYQKDTLNISQNNFIEILNLNKANFSKLQNGDHFLIIDKNGRVYVQGNSLNLNQPSYSIGGYRQFEKFDKIYCFSKLKLNISTKKIVIPDSKKILVGTKKEIKVNSKGKYYIANYLNSSQFHKSVERYYEDGLKKNKYQITQDVDVVYSANDIKIGTKEMYEVLEEGKLSKRMPLVIAKLSSISIIGFFGGLRLYEYIKIPK